MSKASEYIDAVVRCYMETALIVSEEFQSLLDRNLLDDDILYCESDIDTYSTLVDIAIEIEDENKCSGGEYGFEELREKATPMILEEYGKKKEELKTYLVIETECDKHITFHDKAKIIGQFNNRHDAENLADAGNMGRRWIIEQ